MGGLQPGWVRGTGQALHWVFITAYVREMHCYKQPFKDTCSTLLVGAKGQPEASEDPGGGDSCNLTLVQNPQDRKQVATVAHSKFI